MEEHERSEELAGPGYGDQPSHSSDEGAEKTDREEGGPTSPANEPEEDVTGGGPSPKPDGGFDSHE